MDHVIKIELLEIPLSSFTENISRTGYCLAFHSCNSKSFYKIKLMYIGIKMERFNTSNDGIEKFITFDLDKEYISLRHLVYGVSDEIGFVFNGSEKCQFVQPDIRITNPEFRNSGLGSYCMHYAITWAQRTHPNAFLQNVDLVYGDAKTEADKYLRNTFYRKCGFTLIFNDESETEGKLQAYMRDLRIPNIKPAIIIHSNALQQFAIYMQEKFLNENELEKKSKRFHNYISEQTKKMTHDYRQGAKYGIFGSFFVMGIIMLLFYQVYHN